MILYNPFKNTYLLLFFVFNFQLISYAQKSNLNFEKELNSFKQLKTGSERTSLYLSLLEGKNIAIISNQTSVIYKSKVAINNDV